MMVKMNGERCRLQRNREASASQPSDEPDDV